ncbi:hypothetical protein PIB30_009100 [Stylosanthes scabra]|uniref:Uncharacterized protein n=1 Tax=Stylosanthes scabra TaxID=79078 RepID=A0ABU6W685_9FABA|nr:hypothetical protein [Stylosanthes scabra]
MDLRNRNRRVPCSEWRKWDQIIYRFPLPSNKLGATLARNGVSRVWFVDNANNCVAIRMWCDNKGTSFHADDVRQFRNLSSRNPEVGMQIQYLKSEVLSAEIMTKGLMPLDPFPNLRFYAGRILPLDVQKELFEEFGVRFNDTRQLELEEEYIFGEVEHVRFNNTPTATSSTVKAWEQEATSRAHARYQRIN